MKKIHIEVISITSGKLLTKSISEPYTEELFKDYEDIIEKGCCGELNFLTLETHSGFSTISGDAFNSVCINIIIEKEPKIKGKV